ncbi:hypothetical protein DFP75_101653 [Marinomonas alcarazii]|uniref:Uncharacterized protein n=1 Tax=Marinomonas alcarazii TaxID=491949 RepID=A0A318V7N7_9GAMM|nr:hypothetical protein [Marinomonas alcarazii]PYF84614.1 hypothetical protein DFP75_101653 [Marinomonas alcarazii]
MQHINFIKDIYEKSNAIFGLISFLLIILSNFIPPANGKVLSIIATTCILISFYYAAHQRWKEQNQKIEDLTIKNKDLKSIEDSKEIRIHTIHSAITFSSGTGLIFRNANITIKLHIDNRTNNSAAFLNFKINAFSDNKNVKLVNPLSITDSETNIESKDFTLNSNTSKSLTIKSLLNSEFKSPVDNANFIKNNNNKEIEITYTVSNNGIVEDKSYFVSISFDNLIDRFKDVWGKQDKEAYKIIS